MDVQFSDYLTVSCAKKPVAEVKSSRTYKNKWSYHEYLRFLKETPYITTHVKGRNTEERLAWRESARFKGIRQGVEAGARSSVAGLLELKRLMGLRTSWT